jgi:hypothetical protein
VPGSLGKAGSGKARTDVYKVTCAVGTHRLSMSVSDEKPVLAPLISIQATKGGASSPLSTDTRDGNGVFSNVVSLAKGAGNYMMNVNKSAAKIACKKDDDDDDHHDGDRHHDDDEHHEGHHDKCYVKGAEAYIAKFSCKNAAGKNTRTTYKLMQNQ